MSLRGVLIGLALATCCLTGEGFAQQSAGRTGVGGQIGLQKPVGGERDYSNVDQNVSLWLRHGFSPRWSLALGAEYGWNRPGALRDNDAGWTFDSVHAFYTTMLTYYAGARFHLRPASRLGPYLGARVGTMSWQVRDENGTGNFGIFPGGPSARGYNAAGQEVYLDDRNLVGTVTLGVEYFLGEAISLETGTRYNRVMGNDLDTSGASALWGANHADINTGRWDFFVGGTLYFGGSHDKDGDGIPDRSDLCPDRPEDRDGFQDQDGCPEFDNDRDGVLDAVDNCPDDAEDRDGFQDEDGCPDADNDHDGLIDAYDGCPDEAEDRDGFEDEDGCPDPDDDRDGVLDVSDNCPNTPAGIKVGPDGCPLVARLAEQLTLEGVSFELGSARLDISSHEALNRVAESLAAYPAIRVEIQGHTDDSGPADFNLEMSSRRAEAVREYLIERGISPLRLTAVGYGEEEPARANDTPAGRAANRRVELVRIR